MCAASIKCLCPTLVLLSLAATEIFGIPVLVIVLDGQDVVMMFAMVVVVVVTEVDADAAADADVDDEKTLGNCAFSS